MKRVLFVMLAMALMIGIATAAEPEPEPEWQTSIAGCYRYRIQDNGMMVVQTDKQLTSEKQTMATKGEEVQKVCNDLGKSLHGRLMKQLFISGIVVAPREIAIRTYPFPEHPWKMGEAQVLGDLDAVLCGAVKE